MESANQHNRSQYDTTLKDLFQQLPQCLLQAVMGGRAVRHLPVEFASTMKRIPDLVLLMEDGSIAHLELHSQSENLNWRMLGYYSFIRQSHPECRLVQK
ncbi:MAG: hypothetical protein HQL96_09400, partial [Magnetococcales bacterium]|nr:hypothetical protein [Magnetococcales bacterium]